MKGLYIIYSHLLLLVKIKDICSQNVAIEPHPTAFIKQNSSLTLYCSYYGGYGPGKDIIWDWKLDGNRFALLRPIRSGTCLLLEEMSEQTFYRYNCTSNFTTLTILNVGEERHNEIWSCRFETVLVFYDSDNTNIYVKVPVRHVRVSSPAGAYVNVTENVATRFTCLTSVSRPQSTILWHVTGRPSTIRNGSISYSGNITTSTFYYAFNRSENGEKIFCTAVNLDDEPPVESNHKEIFVQYGTDGGPIIEGFSNGATLSIIDLTQQSLTCYVSGYPRPTLRWDCFSAAVTNVTWQKNEVRSTITWTATKDTATSTCSCISQQEVSGQQVYRLTVNLLYPPSRPVFRIGSTMVSGTVSVIRGTNATVTCDALSNPTPRYEWITNSTSVITSSKNLYLGNVQISDQGTYICTVGNIMVPSTGNRQTGNNSSLFTLNILYPPEAPTFKVGTQSLIGNLSVVRGDNVRVTCDSTSNPGPDFRWTGQPPGIRLLTVNSIQVATTKRCTVTNYMVPTLGSSYPGSASASLHIIAMSEPTVPELSYFSNTSSKVHLTTSELVVIRGTSFSVYCLGSTSIPGPPSYEWEGLNTSTASNILSFTDIGNQDAGIYTCHVTNIMARTVGDTEIGRNSKHLVVEVQYPPAIHPIQDYFVGENEPLSLPCTASSNPPPTSYIWTRSKDTFVQQSSTLTIEHPKREDSDAYTCTVRNQMFPTVAEGETNGEESYTLSLKVLYHPDIKLTQMNGTIREGDSNVVLLCSAKGEPQNYTFAKWIHFAPDGKTMIQEHSSTLINNGEAYLIFRNISYMDSGKYQCSVSNGISDYKTGNTFVTSNTDQIVLGRPVIVQTAQTIVSSLHENILLSTTYYSNDGSTPTTEWYIIGDETKTVINQTNKIFSADEALAVTVPFYTVEIAQQGHKALLFIYNVMESDLGEYEVVITNSVGKTASRIRLTVHAEAQTEKTAEQSKEGVTAWIVGGLVGIIVGAVFGALIMFRCRKAIREKCRRSSPPKQEQYYMNEQVISPENMPSAAGDGKSLDIMKENAYEDLDSRRKQSATYESLQPGNRREIKDRNDVYYNLTLQA